MGSPEPHLPQGEDRPAAPADFWAWAEHFRPYLKGVARCVLGDQLQDKVDASDVVQQSLLEAFRQREHFRGRGVPEWQGWLVAIVRNEARNLLRYWHQEKRDMDREKSLAAGSGARPQPAADTSSPSRQAVRREQTARLLAALEHLPAEYREVVRLRNFEALPYAEVAARLGRSEVATRQLWVRAVRRLRDELGDEL